MKKIKNDSNICDEDKENILRYYRELLAKGISYGRIMKYLQTLRIVHHWLNKPMIQAKREDFIDLVSKIERNPNFSEWTKHDYKVILRRYYRWLRGFGDNDPFPEEVRWIKIGVRNANNKLPEDILTLEEVQKIAKAAYTKRDKAFVITLFESGARIGEILPLKIKDLEFEENFCRITLRGKTGDRKIKLVLSYKPLAEWLEEHPNKNNPSAFVWINYNNRKADKPLAYGTICKLLKELAQKAGIKKKVNPHNFRHSSATWRANYFTESQLKEFYGVNQVEWQAHTFISLENSLMRLLIKCLELKRRSRSKNYYHLLLVPDATNKMI